MDERSRAVMQHANHLLSAGALVAALSCDAGTVQEPTTTTLEITTATRGVELDHDGYFVSVDQGTETAIGINARIQRDDIEPGFHTVQLNGLAANCTVEGENPRSVSVTAGEITRLSFELTCTATASSLRITTSTLGPSPDPDGYSFTLDGSDGGTIGANGSLLLEGLVPGSHLVGIGGVADNCMVEGDNPRLVSVPAGGSATAGFIIRCSEPATSA